MKTKEILIVTLLASLIFNLLPAVVFAAGPVISDIHADSISYSSVRIQWHTDVLANHSHVEYDTIHPNGPFDYSTEKKQSIYDYNYLGITLGGLAPATTYYYSVCSTANSIETCSSANQFTTAAAPTNPFTPPALPNSPVLQPMPTINGPTYNVAADCSDLQTDINTAAALSTSANQQILISPSSTCIGNYILPPRSGTGWIVVRSAASDSSLPPEGTRINNSYTPVMPTISALTATPSGANLGLSTINPTANWRFIGINFTAQPGAHEALVWLFPYDYYNNLNQPTNIVFDRDIFTSTPPDGSSTTFGILAEGKDVVIANSSITVINPNTQPCAIDITDAHGVTIQNNSIDTPGISVFGQEGDSGPAPDFVTVQGTSDININHNYFAWDLSYENNSAVRQNIEFKQGNRILIDSNVFTDEWSGGITGSNSDVILIAPRAGFTMGIQSTADYNSTYSVSDLTITNNIMHKVPGGITLFGGDLTNQPGDVASTKRILIKNNLMYDMDGYKYAATGIAVSGTPFNTGGPIEDMVIDHNTAIDPRGVWPIIMTWYDNRGSVVKLTNNVIGQNYSNGYGGFSAQPSTAGLLPAYPSQTASALTEVSSALQAAPNPDPNTSVTGNLFIPGVIDTISDANYNDPSKQFTPAQCTTYWSGLPGNTCAGTSQTITANQVYAAVGFTNTTTNDYSLTPSSPYNHSNSPGLTTDGTDPGVNWAQLAAATANVVSGGASSDTTAPTAPTGLSATALSQTSIALTWTASTDNVGVVGYHVYRGGTLVGSVSTPAYTDTSLAPATAYTYTVTAYDGAGNTSSQSTAAGATTQSIVVIPPSLSSISSGTPTQTSATITWTTSTTADSQVEYGLTTAYGSLSVLGTTLGTSHSVQLDSLQSNTLYHFRVDSRDGNGTLATSTDQTFSTAAIVSSGGGGGGGGGGSSSIYPTISAVVATPLGSTTASVTWTTANIQSTSEVDYGTASKQYSMTVSSPATVISHSATLTDLTPGATYYFQVKSTYSSWTSTAGEYSFQLASSSPNTTPTSPPPSITLTLPSDDIQAKITALKAELASLIAQLADMTRTVPDNSTPSVSLPTTLTHVLSLGSRMSDVSLLQTILAQHTSVYPCKLVTGYFGPATLTAVKAFQQLYGLSSVGQVGYGQVGPKTRQALNTLYAGGALIPVQTTTPPIAVVQPTSSSPTQTQPVTPPVTHTPSQTTTTITVTHPSPVHTAAVTTITDTLSLGSTGPEVTFLQQILAKNPLIYPEAKVTGVYDAATERAVRRFQETYGIVTSSDAEYGVVGVKTRGRIGTL